MQIFLTIAVMNIVLLFLLIAVHECGHWICGRLAGLPGEAMRIRLLTFPQQVVLRDADGSWVSVADFDRYWAILERHVPARGGRFLYVVGGFIAETLAITGIAVALALSGHVMYSMVATGVSLLMYLIYVFAMDLPQSREKQRPWGDTTILISLARGPGSAVAATMVLWRLALLAFALLADWLTG